MTSKLKTMVEVTLTGSDLAAVLTDQLCSPFSLLADLEVTTIVCDAGSYRLTLLPKPKPLRVVKEAKSA